jgi:hypothetical protein
MVGLQHVFGSSGETWPKPATSPPPDDLAALAARLGIAWPQPLTPNGQLIGVTASTLLRDIADESSRADAEKFITLLKQKGML